LLSIPVLINKVVLKLGLALVAVHTG
jgi:hypothetical protein